MKKMSRGPVYRLVVLAVAAGSAIFAGCRREPPPPAVWTSGTTVIPANASWDAVSDSTDDGTQADLHWQQVSPAERYLAPVNGARAAVVKHRSYEQVDGVFLRRWHMPKESMPAGDADGMLAPGTVVAFRTAEGTLGKLEVIGFRPASSSEAGGIEIKWTLFRP